METKSNEQRRISRRCFLVLAGGTISAISIGWWLPCTRFGHAGAVKFPEWVYPIWTRCALRHHK